MKCYIRFLKINPELSSKLPIGELVEVLELVEHKEYNKGPYMILKGYRGGHYLSRHLDSDVFEYEVVWQ